MPLILQPDLYRWNLYALPWGVVGVALFVLAVMTFQRQRGSRVAQLFSLMIVLAGLWFAGFCAMLASEHASVAAIWAHIALAAVCLLPAAVYAFTVTTLRLKTSRAHVVTAGWIVAGLFALICLFSRGIVDDVGRYPWGFYPVAGAVAPYFLVVFALALLGQLAEGIAEYRRTDDPKRRRRIGRLMISFVIVYFATIDFVPMFGVRMPPLGYVPVLAFILIAWSSIRRHRLQAITAAWASREILQTMADALFVLDADGRIRVMNDAAARLIGRAPSEILGRSIDTVEKAGSGDDTIVRTLAELSQRGSIREQERQFRDASGHTIDVSVSISPVSEQEVRRGAVLIARDIRERKRAEQEMQSFMTRLEQSNRELEDFAYVASHDLQEPLRKIQAFGDLLKSKHAAALPEQARDYIDRMHSAARRMQVLINDLLSFSRVTTKAQPFVRVDLTTVAHEVARDLEIRTQEAHGAIAIGDLPTIEADPMQMRQLLQNLAGNSLKFHKPDRPPVVTIEGELHPTFCEIRVQDNGIGFEEKYAERVFTMFERLHGRAQYEGTGIGLSICRRIAERHGGTIVAHGRPGEGATFVVRLPISHDVGIEN